MTASKFKYLKSPILLVVALLAVISFYSIFVGNSTKIEVSDKKTSIKFESAPPNKNSPQGATPNTSKEKADEIVQTSKGNNSSNNYSSSDNDSEHGNLKIEQHSLGSNSPNTVNH